MESLRPQDVFEWLKTHTHLTDKVNDGFGDHCDLLKVAHHFAGELTDTGGGIECVIIPAGAGRCIGVSADCVNLYIDADSSKSPYDIFWDNDAAEEIAL